MIREARPSLMSLFSKGFGDLGVSDIRVDLSPFHRTPVIYTARACKKYDPDEALENRSYSHGCKESLAVAIPGGLNPPSEIFPLLFSSKVPTDPRIFFACQFENSPNTFQEFLDPPLSGDCMTLRQIM